MGIYISYEILIQTRILLEFYGMLSLIDGPVKVEHKITDIVLDLCGLAVSVLMYLLNEIEDLRLDRIERYTVEVIYILLVDAGLLHDIAVGRRDTQQLIAIILTDPEDKTLIVYIGIVNDCIVGNEGRYQYQVPG